MLVGILITILLATMMCLISMFRVSSRYSRLEEERELPDRRE